MTNTNTLATVQEAVKDFAMDMPNRLINESMPAYQEFMQMRQNIEVRDLEGWQVNLLAAHATLWGEVVGNLQNDRGFIDWETSHSQVIDTMTHTLEMTCEMLTHVVLNAGVTPQELTDEPSAMTFLGDISGFLEIELAGSHKELLKEVASVKVAKSFIRKFNKARTKRITAARKEMGF